jgi:IS605 OrfB family transposase
MNENTIVKSMAVKVCATSAKLDLYHIIRDYTDVASKVCDDIMSLSGRSLKNKDNEVILSSNDILQKMSIDKEIPEKKLRIAAKGFYDFFLNSSNSRGLVAFLTQAETSSVNEHASVLRKYGIMPYNHKGKLYDVLDGRGGYKYGVIGSIHGRLTSWIECDEQTHKDWQNLQLECNKLHDELSKAYADNVLFDLDNWIGEVQKLKFPISRKFFDFFESSLLKSLKEGKPSSFGIWKTNSGKDVEYSCPDEVVNLLFTKYTSLWKTECSVLLDRQTLAYIEKKLEFLHKKEYASYKKIDLLNSPIRLLLGNNYVAINNTNGLVCDSVNKKITISIKTPKRLQGENENDWLSIPCTYNRAFKGKKGYFENLSITPDVAEDGKSTGKYIFKYSINGKRPCQALVKEPSFRLVIRNQNFDVNNPKITDFDIYLIFSMNVQVNPCHSFETNTLWKIRAAFSKSYPELKDLGRQKTVSINEDVVVDAPLTVMGIDLGIRNPFAYSIYKYTNGKKYEEIKKGVVSKENLETISKYNHFRSACFFLKKLITSTRYYLKGNKPTIDGGWLQNLNNYFTNNIQNYTPITIEQYTEWVNNHKEIIPFIDFKKKENGWVVRSFTFYLRDILKGLTNDRKYGNNQFSTHFNWISCQESFIKMMRAYQMSGVDTKAQLQKGKTYSKIKERITNLKLDYMKKLGFMISEIAKENGVAIVITEKLENLRGNVYNDKDRNQLYNNWPVGQIKHYLENALNNYGILHSEADERHSSQVVSKNGIWGYRDEEDLNCLWWKDTNGNIVWTHADENAASNLCERYLSKHTKQNSVWMTKISDTIYVPASALTTATEKKREKGFLSKCFSVSRPVFELTGGYLTLSNKSYKDVSKGIKTKASKPEAWFFTDNSFSKLMNKSRRDLEEDELKKKVESMKEITNHS